MAKKAAAPAANAEAENPRAVPGDNNPPTQRELMAETHADLAARIEALAARANGAPKKIGNDEQFAAVAEIVVDARKLSKDERAAFEKEKAPWLAGGREVDQFFNIFRDRLKKIAEALQNRANTYTEEKAAKARAEAEAKAKAEREEAERQARLAEKHSGSTARQATHDSRAQMADDRAVEAEAQAGAKAADLTRTRLDTGSGSVTASAREEWVAEITDWAAVPLDALRPYFKPDEIEKALAKYAKANQDRAPLAGVKFRKKTRANIR